jgi:hypothetical protein
MPHSASHLSWRSSDELLDEAKQYKIRTLHEEYFLFDVATGDIVYEFRAPPMIADFVREYDEVGEIGDIVNETPVPWAILAGLAALILLAGSAYGWIYRKGINAEQNAPADPPLAHR